MAHVFETQEEKLRRHLEDSETISKQRYDALQDAQTELLLKEGEYDLLSQERDALLDYQTWYAEAICASNELGYAGMSAADVIKHQAEEIASLKAKGGA